MHASRVQNIFFQFMNRFDYSIDSDFPCVRDPPCDESTLHGQDE